MAVNLSTRECRNARLLLKWNFQDLASKTRMRAKRIEGFERGSIELIRPEIEELHKVFITHGVEFKPGSVELSKGAKAKAKTQATHRAVQSAQATAARPANAASASSVPSATNS